MSALKSFILGVAKIAAVIVVVAVVLGLLGWGFYEFKESRRVASEASLSTPKKWAVVKVEALDGVELRLSTMWRGSSMYYRFSTRGYPPTLASVRDAAGAGTSRSEPAWTLVFLDENGFKVFEHDVGLRKMAKLVGDSTGRGSGLEINDQTFVDAETYRRASSWEVTWNFEVPRPTASIARPRVATGGAAQDRSNRPSWRDKSRWRQLRIGLSKDEVRRILGEPENVTESGAIKVWYYGSMRQGEVDFDESDNVSFWSEP